MAFLASVFILSLAIALNEAGEWCKYPYNNFYCINYCCSYSGTCCDNCYSSIQNHSDCYNTDVGSIVGGIIGFIAFVVIVSLIVACCCGCICSARTGIQRRGRVVAQPAAVTVISQDQTYYPPAQCTYPQGQVTYPPAPVGNSDYQRAAYPVYPTNQGYVNPPPYGGYYPDQNKQ